MVSVVCASAGAATGSASSVGCKAASWAKADKVEIEQKTSVVVKWRIPWSRERRGLKYQQFWGDLAS